MDEQQEAPEPGINLKAYRRDDGTAAVVMDFPRPCEGVEFSPEQAAKLGTALIEVAAIATAATKDEETT